MPAIRAPFLCLGDYPQNYLESPAAEVVKALKPIYDETIILPGSEIGECVAVAKRKDEKWFIAIENGAEDRSLEIPLPFLRSGKWKMKKFADAEGSNTEFDISECTVSPSDTLKLALRAKGGFVAVIEPELDCAKREKAKFMHRYGYYECSCRRKRRVPRGLRTRLRSGAIERNMEMCKYPVSNIQYPLSNDGGANWILAVGYFHISTLNKCVHH